MKNKKDLILIWTRKADHDLITAEAALGVAEDTPFDTICFHAQQCAEKYLKAYLLSRDINIEKTHNLEDLITLAATADSSFEEIINVAGTLTPYAVEARYPGMLDEELTLEDADEAVEISKQIKDFIVSRMDIQG